ncbi:hemerythrin domain-containing protein [Actinoplanes sp. RD1]|uniref:hemerythrin domain-containing protein n=1 Tax=Actinoplanes sp. RD1 TaxID=3064538 RepID=UPI0027427327|nr:hemerythrin domain-containing protein [Actinoplanes sp. RD1]
MTVDTWEMVLVHRVFRREFRILPAIIRAVPPGDKARAEVVGEHLGEVSHGLHHHHEAEDELLWPIMLDRVGLHADVVHRMEAQHLRLAELLGRLDALNSQWRASARQETRDGLADVVAQVSPVLEEHLGDEERDLLPLVSEFVTQAEWDALGERGKEILPRNDLRKALVFLGASLEEASPAEARRFLATLPLPARVLWALFGKRTYATARDRVRQG